MLLVLDNCEHLVDAVARIAEDLLGACADVGILATSREALRVNGEAVWPVPPLGEVDAVEFIRQFLSQQYAPMIARFKDAFARALPHLPRKELSWRLHFIMGALSYTLAGTDALKIIAELNPVETDNDEMLLRRLAPFLLAGLTAPLPELSDVSREFDSALG